MLFGLLPEFTLGPPEKRLHGSPNQAGVSLECHYETSVEPSHDDV